MLGPCRELFAIAKSQLYTAGPFGRDLASLNKRLNLPKHVNVHFTFRQLVCFLLLSHLSMPQPKFESNFGCWIYALLYWSIQVTTCLRPQASTFSIFLDWCWADVGLMSGPCHVEPFLKPISQYVPQKCQKNKLPPAAAPAPPFVSWKRWEVHNFEVLRSSVVFVSVRPRSARWQEAAQWPWLGTCKESATGTEIQCWLQHELIVRWYICICIHAHTHMYIFARISMKIWLYIYIYIDINIHTYTCLRYTYSELTHYRSHFCRIWIRWTCCRLYGISEICHGGVVFPCEATKLCSKPHLFSLWLWCKCGCSSWSPGW